MHVLHGMAYCLYGVACKWFGECLVFGLVFGMVCLILNVV